MAKTTVSFETDDIPTIIDVLEESLDGSCGDAECEDCVIKSLAITEAIEALYKKAKKIHVEF